MRNQSCSTAAGAAAPLVKELLSLLLPVACAAHPPALHLDRIPLHRQACTSLSTCLDVLERSSELEAQEVAEEGVAAFGSAALPRLSWLVEHGDAISKYRAAGALGRIAATAPEEVLAVAGSVLRERCADSGWAACWALACANDRSAYPLVRKHLADGVAGSSVFDDRPVPAAAAERLIVALEDRSANAAVHGGVVDILLRAKGPRSGAALDRLRKLLQAELPVDLDNVPEGYPCISSGDQCWALVEPPAHAEQCPASYSRCWSRVDYLVEAVGAWGHAGLPARDELHAIWESSPAPHKYIARRALARTGDRAIVPSLLRELSPLDQRALRDLSLLGEAARPELPQLIALYQSAPGKERAILLETILAIGGPLAVAIGIEALHMPGDDDVTALKGLLAASQGDTQPDALRKEKARLESLVAQSPYAQVRRLAGELLVALGFEAPALRGPLPCPSVMTTQIEARAALAGGPVTFKSLGNPARNSEECAKGDIAAIRTGNECLHGHSSGEFGYQITVHDVGSAQSRGSVRGVGLNPVQFLRYGGHLLIVEGLAHGMAMGSIDRLVRESDGRWVAHRFTDLPGLPWGHTFDAEGSLLLLVRVSYGELCHFENEGWQVLRIDRQGELTALR